MREGERRSWKAGDQGRSDPHVRANLAPVVRFGLRLPLGRCATCGVDGTDARVRRGHRPPVERLDGATQRHLARGRLGTIAEDCAHERG